MPLFPPPSTGGGGGGLTVDANGFVQFPGWAYPCKLIDQTTGNNQTGPVLIILWNGQEIPIAFATPPAT